MAAHSKNFVILACIVSIRLQSVMDGRTDGRTDIQTTRPWLKCAKHSAISRKNAQNSTFSGAVPHAPLGELTALA